jgi:hypothetical protein
MRRRATFWAGVSPSGPDPKRELVAEDVDWDDAVAAGFWDAWGEFAVKRVYASDGRVRDISTRATRELLCTK